MISNINSFKKEFLKTARNAMNRTLTKVNQELKTALKKDHGINPAKLSKKQLIKPNRARADNLTISIQTISKRAITPLMLEKKYRPDEKIFRQAHKKDGGKFYIRDTQAGEKKFNDFIIERSNINTRYTHKTGKRKAGAKLKYENGAYKREVFIIKRHKLKSDQLLGLYTDSLNKKAYVILTQELKK